MTANRGRRIVRLWSLLAVLSLLGGAVAGHLWGQTCQACYNIFDADPSGKYNSNKCFLGYCQGATSQSMCYREICKSCTKQTCKAPGSTVWACPAGGNCPGGKPIAHWACQNSCGC